MAHKLAVIIYFVTLWLRRLNIVLGYISRSILPTLKNGVSEKLDFQDSFFFFAYLADNPNKLSSVLCSCANGVHTASWWVSGHRGLLKVRGTLLQHYIDMGKSVGAGFKRRTGKDWARSSEWFRKKSEEKQSLVQ